MARISKTKNNNTEKLETADYKVVKKPSRKPKEVEPKIDRKPPVKLRIAKKDLDQPQTSIAQNRFKTAMSVKRSDPKRARPIIQVKNLVKKYSNFIAVNNVSFDVKKGEIFGILGPNGAGKTTTLEMIETLVQKTSGQIFIDGLNIDTYPEHVKKVVGVQLQSSGFYPRINLVETLEMFADIYDVNVDALGLLKSVNLLDKAKSNPDQLSGGQRQRFSIVCTLVSDPLIIFLDEPTTGLDPQARRNLWDIIIDLKNKGKTIVLTTHYMDEAEVLCDRIAIMDGGKILEINTSLQFVENLLAKGFKRPQPKLGATLEDVFLDLTGRQLRE
jgi:ABC-2 type transport system ATP-binding protein